MRLYACYILLGVLALACTTQEVCDDVYDSELVLRFVQQDSTGVIDTTLSGLSLWGIGRADSLICNNIAVAQASLPLDPANSECSFIWVSGEQRDTLRIRYGTEPYMLSYKCGFAMRFNLEQLDYGGELIRGDTIIESIIDADTESNDIHAWLYF